MPVVPPSPSTVTDPSDPRLSAFAGLRDRDRRLRRPPPHEAAAGPVFAVEGRRVAERALAAGCRPVAVLAADDPGAVPPAGLPPEVPVLRADADLIRRVTGLGVVREAITLFARPPERTAVDVLAGASRVTVLEGVANPVNVGVLIRTAAALGVDATLVAPGTADPLYRRAVRGSMGAVLTHPWARIPALPGGLAPLRARGFAVLALTPDPAAVPLGAALAGAGPRVALLLGSEGEGLTPAAIAAADVRTGIPMHGGVDSLNVAAAAAIAVHALTTGR
jgi:tRNA G18 (ribose-2'-O)-methylase SpoU